MGEYAMIEVRFFASGDAPFFFDGQLKSLSWLPQVFDASNESGISMVKSLWLDYPFQVVVKLLSTIGLSWWVIDKLLWTLVFTLAAYSSYRLARYVLKNSGFAFLCPFIYIGNTYFLLLFSGGQLGIALSYGLAPYVLYRFIKTIDQIDKEVFSIWYLVSGIKNGLLLALLVCFDLRIAYLVMGVVGMYLVFSIWYLVLHKKFSIPNTIYQILYTIAVPLFVAMAIHMFWILPMVMVRQGASGITDVITNPGMLRFLSFTDFPHTLSLLHPNWPENLFGKVYFLQPEFLILPLLAFGALLFLDKTNPPTPRLRRASRTQMFFFSLLALIGVFLAKGTNEPLGGIYTWAFEHIPGFVMFRDPTKFYVFIALSYSVLIPFTLQKIAERESIWYLVSGIWYKKKQENFILNTRYLILYTIFLCFWCFTIRAIFAGQITGNFSPLPVPEEYTTFKNYLINNQQPYRTLWIPRLEKFTYASDIHPVYSTVSLFSYASPSAMVHIIKSPVFQETIRDKGIKYIIVSLDREKKLFLTDYRFDKSLRNELINALTAGGFQRRNEFGDLAVFENQTYVFQEEKPAFVVKQQYWLFIGLVVSVVSLVTCLSILVAGEKTYGG